MKAKVWINFNNFPIDLEEKFKNLEETIIVLKNVNTFWRIIRAFVEKVAGAYPISSLPYFFSNITQTVFRATVCQTKKLYFPASITV